MSLLIAAPKQSEGGTELEILGVGFYKDVAPTALGNIPKGLRHSAQRCRDAGTATLGSGRTKFINSEGVESNRSGNVMQPRWG